MADAECLLSPQRPQNPQTATASTPPQWKRPEDVMRLHKLRVKQKALNARCSRSITESSTIDNAVCQEKRKNPFRLNKSVLLKKCRNIEEDGNSLLQMLGLSTPQPLEPQLSFPNLIGSAIDVADTPKPAFRKGSKELPVDWTLRNKVRFMSPKPFPWNQNLRTQVEASAITAFVRCIDSGTAHHLDTSANAQFHSACLYWLAPSLPWLQLYPRAGPASRQPHASGAGLPSMGQLAATLHSHWAESFRAVFQLVRAHQCPYFYLVANSFTCLFRAAGITGHSQINALLTPTTRGFRKILTQEDIVYTMPLCKNKESEAEEAEEDEEEGNDVGGGVAGEEETEEWLQSLGVAEDDIKRISSSQSDADAGKAKYVDRTSESLVFVEGIEAQALFNFLINCKSSVATTGLFAGIPPTLLAPVAFHGATLTPLKVRESRVKTNDGAYCSLELRGPILPHCVHALCNVLRTTCSQFSVTFQSNELTKHFTLAHSAYSASGSASSSVARAIGVTNLSDCGLKENLLKQYCSGNVQPFDNITFADQLFCWS